MPPSLSPTPSPQLLRALRSIIHPAPFTQPQFRTIAQSAFRKPNNITALDKLHRQHKRADRQEVTDSYLRATSPSFASAKPSRSPQHTPAAPPTDERPLQNKIPYHIHRTPSSRLPVYHDSKRGGNQHLTLIRKLSGDLELLKSDLSQALGLDGPDAQKIKKKGRKVDSIHINWTTKQIVVRGWRAPEVRIWAEGMGF
ncbi:MAG: hypothetical protein Q9160_001184 [Pyrenula sp. 1 TL-2023]